MARVSVLTRSRRTPGAYTLGPRAIPDALTTLAFSLDTARTVGVNWSLDVEMSTDGGATWHYIGGAGCLGGEADESSTTSGVRIAIPPGTGRQLRGTLTIEGGAYTSDVGVEL